MLTSLFLSKNQKLVKRWTKEHRQLVLLIHLVLAEYSKNNHKKSKKILIELNNLLVDHVTDENIEFYKLMKDEHRASKKHIEETEEFIATFKDVRLDLMKFLTQYTKKSTVLDEHFFMTLNQMAEVLVERIEFEESNLYHSLLHSTREAEVNSQREWDRMKRKF